MEAHREGELEPREQQCSLGIGHRIIPEAWAGGSIGRTGWKSHPVAGQYTPGHCAFKTHYAKVNRK